jgi:hypothetical protein
MESEVLMSEKDGKSKEFLKVNERFADAFNYYMYGGEQVINPEDLEERDATELLTVYGIDFKGNINGKTQQRWRDLLKYAIIKKTYDCYYVLFGIENQSDIHYAVAVKNMLYDAINYGAQVTETARKHRENKDAMTDGEFLSGFTKEDKLIPVITLTIYWGAEEWDAPRSLYEMFRELDREAFSKFVPDYWVNLIVPKEIDDFDKFSSELGSVLEVIKASNDKNEMKMIIIGNPKFASVRNDVIDVLNTFTGSKLKANMKGERTDMCKAVEDLLNSSKDEGKIEERQRINKLNSILAKLDRIDDLIRSTEDEQFQKKLLDELVPEGK